MDWTGLLQTEVEDAYRATEGLLSLAEDKNLDWKPSTGQNWMTMGQLLLHITGSCGVCCKGFVTGDWGFPEGVDPSSLPPEEMLPPAEKLPSVQSVAEAKKLLAEDKKLALQMIAKAGEKDLAGKMCKAPWDATEVVLGRHLLGMIGHLALHKAQLFYYLKLQGRPLNTGHLFGMQG
ncbi:MAG: DinB family protein [Candidatus Eiseniibacteriota bacterium]|nr:MAG: DinB family protein [Candidatus Eisenbacteria bacterium]